MNMNKRPVVTSPHLQIYRPQLTSILSISHRVAGVTILVGFLLLAIGFSLALLSPTTYVAITNSIPPVVFSIALFIFSAAWIYHLLNGIRHLLWDKLVGLEIQQVYMSGYLMLAAWIITLIGVWLL